MVVIRVGDVFDAHDSKLQGYSLFLAEIQCGTTINSIEVGGRFSPVRFVSRVTRSTPLNKTPLLVHASESFGQLTLASSLTL